MLAILFFFLCATRITHSTTAEDPYLTFTTPYPAAYDVAGFDWLSRLEVFRIFDGKEKLHSFTHGGHEYQVKWRAELQQIELKENGVSVAQLNLMPVLQRLRQSQKPQGFSQAELTEDVVGKRGHFRVYIEDISAKWSGENPVLYHFKADLLYRAKAPGKGL